jgi:translation initiation factor IF-1
LKYSAKAQLSKRIQPGDKLKIKILFWRKKRGDMRL